MSKYAEGLKKGTSLAFFGGVLDFDVLNEIGRIGIECVEISSKFEYLVHKIGFLKNAERYGEMIPNANLELWSLHLPFGAALGKYAKTSK